MCGITGIVSEDKWELQFIKQMAETLKHRGPDALQYYDSSNVALGHTRLAIIDLQDGAQPMQREHEGEQFTIVYNGELYNTANLRTQLEEYGYRFHTKSDTEVLLVAFIHWREDCLNHLDGIFAFAIWMEQARTLFLARDRFGVKPLFYAKIKDHFIFASEIKAILAHPSCLPIVTGDGLKMLLSIGPSRVPGKTVYRDILEVKPGHYCTVHQGEIKEKNYYRIQEQEHSDSVHQTIAKVRDLVEAAVVKQLVSDVPVCTFLSGGIDSSIISQIASEHFDLHTFSLAFNENTNFFQPNEFQRSEDQPFVEEMVNTIESTHTTIVLEQQQLFQGLKEALIAKDYPSMADIDSSLLLFSESVAKQYKVGLSGECADELFGGYPWFRSEELGFPWIQSVEERIALLKPSLKGQLALDETKKRLEQEALDELQGSSNQSKILFLNQQYFMQTLLERKDRMTMANGLEVRVPFADHHLVEYVWNIPHEMKRLHHIEKGLLREAFAHKLPPSITWRKKNPFPKTHHPIYTELVQQDLRQRFSNPTSILHQLFDEERFHQLIESAGEAFKKPWFGQLMTGPQLLAYFIQLDEWFTLYKVQLEL